MKLALMNIISEEDQNLLAPVGLGYLKTFLEKTVDDVEVIIIDDVVDIESENVDIVGFSAISQDYGRAIEKARLVKEEYRIPTIIGGYHISMLPTTLAPEFDVGVIGEGEKTLSELVLLFKERKAFPPSHLRKIPGLVFRDGDTIAETEPRSLISPLDSIPFPDRASTKKPWQSIGVFSSRGCPYKCKFCCSTRFWKKTRYFSPEYVIAEISSIVDDFPEVKTIAFCDDLFVSSRKRLRRIIELLEREGHSKSISFTCNVRANLVDNELCELLLRGGIRQVSFGLESANDRMLKQLKGNTITVDTCRTALELLSNHGIATNCTYIIGTPGETETEARDTFDFVLANVNSGKISDAICSIMCPLPGTPMWDYARKNGFVSETMDWSRLSYYTWGGGFFDVLTLDDWIRRRKLVNATYINPTVDEATIYALIKEYDTKITDSKLRRMEREFQPRIAEWLESVSRGVSSVVCYGACDLGRVLVRMVNKYGLQVVGVADGDQAKWGRQFCGFDVISKDAITALDPDAVLICSVRRKHEILRQIKFLEDRGISVLALPNDEPEDHPG